MAYKYADWGPGEIAALQPTIGLTSRVPTIGGEDKGRPIPMAGCAGCGIGSLGSIPVTPVSIGAGFLLGGALMWWFWGREKPLMGRF